MKIIFLGGWGFSTANLSTLYGKHWQGKKILFFSWENWGYCKEQAKVIPTPLFSCQLTPLFTEPCIIVAWSLGAFCLHAYLEAHGQKKEQGHATIKKIILISCAKSFVQSRANRYGVPTNKLNRMSNIMQNMIQLPAEEQAQTSHKQQFKQKNMQQFRQMMRQFYQNIFSTANSKDNNKENYKDNFISQKLLQTNQQLWQKSKMVAWGRPLLTGLQQLATITLQVALPYPVWILQGQEDLILNQRGAEQMAQEFGYPYISYPETGHFVPAEKILEIMQL